ncbi:MAG TPA: redoxin domain-containing protein [Jatrophihabitantaceae bacterium]|jgi:thiol-disulfide isomerase/thioredoxin
MSIADPLHLPRRDAAPPLTGATGWLNTEPLAPEDLRGHVVLYVFWTYTCINWLRASPYVRAWQAKYREQGLVVVGIHTPEFEFERDIDNITAAVHSHELTFPIVLDSEYLIWQAFDNHYWPAMYLADVDGAVRYQHFGEGRYAEAERAVQRLLSDAGAATIDADLVAPDATGDDAPADWTSLKSFESYLGFGRAGGFASPGGAVPDAPRAYHLPASLARNRWALSGRWTVSRERVAVADPGASLAIGFHARDLHLVLAPAARGKALRFQVTIDEHSPGAAAGLDIGPDGAGLLSEPRMYQLLRQQQPITDRIAHITFLDAGVAAYVITFG